MRMCSKFQTPSKCKIFQDRSLIPKEILSKCALLKCGEELCQAFPEHRRRGRGTTDICSIFSSWAIRRTSHRDRAIGKSARERRSPRTGKIRSRFRPSFFRRESTNPSSHPARRSRRCRVSYPRNAALRRGADRIASRSDLEQPPGKISQFHIPL